MTAAHATRALVALLLAVPGGARAASIGIEGGAIVLGRTESSPVTIRVDEAPGTEDRPLRLSVNVGTFSDPVRVGPGKYRAVYVPPSTRFPQVALAAVWRETGPDARIEFLRFPLFGLTRIPVTAKAGAEVRARTTFDSFGPVTADRRGRAQIPVSVPPDVHEAQILIQDRGGASVAKTVPIEVPPYNRLTAALVPHAVVADGQSWVRLDALYDLGGADVPPDRVKVQPSVGTAVFQSAGRGRYVFRYVPPTGTTASAIAFSVSVQGDPVAKAAAKLTIGLPPAARVLVRAPAKPLAAGSPESGVVGVVVMDAAGMGLAGQKLELTANAEPLAPVVYKGDGVYEIPYRAPATYPPGGLVQFQAAVADPSGKRIAGSANYQLQAAPTPGSVRAFFDPSPVPVGGRGAAHLSLEVRDAAGLPLDQAQLLLVASDGAVGKLEEKGRGRYETTYQPPASLPEGDAVLKVVDANGGFERTLALPLRSDPRQFLLGVTAAYAASPGDVAGPRFGLDVWVPWSAGGATFGVGLDVTYGTAKRTVTDPTGTLSSTSEATFVPVALKVAYEALAGRRLALSFGAGAVATLGQFQSSLAGPEQSGWGFGGVAFATGTWSLGPGQAFLELSYSYAPVETADYRLDAGGPAATLGYRVGIF
jgi:hypothetical protein